MATVRNCDTCGLRKTSLNVEPDGPDQRVLHVWYCSISIDGFFVGKSTASHVPPPHRVFLIVGSGEWSRAGETTSALRDLVLAVRILIQYYPAVVTGTTTDYI